jgi:hypothetical protein
MCRQLGTFLYRGDCQNFGGNFGRVLLWELKKIIKLPVFLHTK